MDYFGSPFYFTPGADAESFPSLRTNIRENVRAGSPSLHRLTRWCSRLYRRLCYVGLLVRRFRYAQPPVITNAALSRASHDVCFCLLIRIVEINLQYTFARCKKYSSKLDISCSLIRIFALNCINVSCCKDIYEK